MKRYATKLLKDWKDRPNRKPLVIRGARQVGKSYLVRMFAEEYFDNFIEINFELEIWAQDLFAQKNIQEILFFWKRNINKR